MFSICACFWIDRNIFAANYFLMDLSKIKMVVTDMDGTLLNSKHEVSPLFFQLFEKLKQKNIHFVAASGRQYHSIIEKLDFIKNDILVIAENGAIAKERDKVILKTPLPRTTILKLLKIVTKIDSIYPILCGNKKAYINANSGDFVEKFREYYTAYGLLENMEDFDDEIFKIAIYHYVSSEAHIYPHVKHLEDELQVKVSGQNWVDLSHENANKGFALKKLQEIYNVSPSETMVFGDYNNDLEMLALADYSFAMDNAHPNVKAVSNYSTTSNDDFGVERVLERLLL